jgi:hypothetical protein
MNRAEIWHLDPKTIATDDVVENMDLTWLIYPNPSDKTLMIDSEIQLESINIYDNLGRVVLHNILNDRKLVIETSSLPNGLYIVFAAFENGKQSIKKLVIQH